MELEPYLATLRDDLDRATSLADDATRTTALRLLAALEAPVRLLLIQALTDAAAHLTATLPGTVVEVRMSGRDPDLHVTTPQPEPTTQAVKATEQGEGTTRITLRLPDAVKARADAAASAEGVSLNTWITNACRAAAGPTPHRTARRVTGWA